MQFWLKFIWKDVTPRTSKAFVIAIKFKTMSQIRMIASDDSFILNGFTIWDL